MSFQSTILLPITLLAILVASSASPVPTDTTEDFSDLSFLSHPNEKTDIVLKFEEGEGQWNDIIEANEPRHLERRSPSVLKKKFFKTKKVSKPKVLKKTVVATPKLVKKKKISKPKVAKKLKKASPVLKKGAKVAAPAALAAGGTGLAASAGVPALPLSLPALPALPTLAALPALPALPTLPAVPGIPAAAVAALGLGGALQGDPSDR